MKRYTFSFLQDYMSAKGIELKRCKEKGAKYQLNNGLSGKQRFRNLQDLRSHISNFY